jgi:acyl CoA:acetate/3-ketoacid CoA transferase alpha subunit
MIDKFVNSVAEALEGIKDGATILVGGFGAVGQANQLIDGLIENPIGDLAIAAQCYRVWTVPCPKLDCVKFHKIFYFRKRRNVALR